MYTRDDFVWDEKKNRSNFAKHKIRFEDAMHIFNGIMLMRQDKRQDYKEVRYLSFGNVEDEAILAVAHTDRAGKIRIFSARKAKRKERNIYEAFIKKTAEGDCGH